MQNIFSSSQEYKKIFNDGLVELSRDESLGTFILAMANATFDEEIYSAIKTSLQGNFLHLKQKYIDCFSQGKSLNEVDEDLLVF